LFQKLKQDLRRFNEIPNAKLAVLGLLLMPLDSSYLFPMDSQYRPLWIIPFCFTGMLNTFFRKFNKDVLFVYGIGLFIVLTSLMSFFYFEYPNSSAFTKTIIVSLIGTTGYVGLSTYVKNVFLRFGTQEGLRVFSSVILVLSLPVIVVGLIQIPGEIFGFHEINSSISSLFSTRYVPGRIHLMSGEPSWAARYLLMILIFSVYVPYRGIKEFRYLLLILLIFTASSLGFLSAFFIAGIYIIISIKFRLEKLFFYLILMVFIFIVISNYELLLFFSPYAIQKINSIYQLIQSLDFETLMLIASKDASILARIVNPIVAFDLALQYPFGIGGDAFKFWIIDYINSYGYSGYDSEDYILGAGSTPKLLFAKILVECGIPFTLFLMFYYLRMVKRSIRKPTLFLILSVVGLTLSVDSFLFYGLLIPICIAQHYLYSIKLNSSVRTTLL
jgi:hypothetical protein